MESSDLPTCLVATTNESTFLRLSVSLSNRMTQTYTLNVKDEVQNKTYKLKFPGTRTVLEVKSDVYSLIDVPVRNQQWKGWPNTLKDDNVVLAQSGICYPEHDLSVGKLPAKEEKKVVRVLLPVCTFPEFFAATRRGAR